MLSDAEIRELAIQNERKVIAAYEERFAAEGGVRGTVDLMLYEAHRGRLEQLETEAADDLELAKQLGGK